MDRTWVAVAITSVAVFSWIAPPAHSSAAEVRVERAKSAPKSRARPPATWDKAVDAVFLDDAFTSLEGERPDFAAAAPVRAPAAASPGAATAHVDGNSPGGGIKWSKLVSPDTLADEIKDMHRRAASAVSSASGFKGGGYDDARVGFGTVALAFAVIHEHDGDVRWRKDAERARDLFARVSANCKVGTDQSLKEARARVEDLAALLEGNSIETTADRDEDFKWSQVAGRPALMSRLEAIEATAAAATSSKDDFTKQVERLLHEVEVAAVIGEVIQRPDYEDHDDATYRGHASAMRDAAIDARAATLNGNYDAARAAVGAMKKACDACHGDYRG